MKTYKMCWFRRRISYALLWTILLAISVYCGRIEAATLRLDTGFTPDFWGIYPGDTTYINDIQEQKDGKILVAGFFDTVDGTNRRGIARLNGDGSLDLGFDPGTGIDDVELKRIGVLPTGQIILAGYLYSINGVRVKNLARLNENGSLDTSFTAETDFSVWDMDITGDKITIGGQFWDVNGIERRSVARLNADGTLNTAFNPGRGVTSSGHWVRAVAVDKSKDALGAYKEKILVGGDFTSFDGIACSKLVLLSSTGAVDTSFSTGSGFNSLVSSLIVQPDGKYLVGGGFTTFNGTPCSGIIRLLNTGALDSSFKCQLDRANVSSMALQNDGRIVIGGAFTTVNGVPRLNVAGLNPDGSLDVDFDPGEADTYDYVRTVTTTGQGQVIIGGRFISKTLEHHPKVYRFNADSSMGGAVANPHTVFAGGQDDWKQISLPRPSVNTGTLDLVVEGTLYYLSTLGPPVYIRLTYNSNLHNFSSGGFGKRWGFLYESSVIQKSPNQVLLRKGTGETETYSSLISLDGGSATPNSPLTLAPMKGNFNQLIFYGDYWLYKEKDTGFTYRYDAQSSGGTGYLTRITDRNNNALTITTDLATGRVQKITDSANRQFSFTYNTNGYCSRITVPDGRIINFTYDGDGQLIQIKDMIGYLGKYTYDNGYMTKSDLGDLVSDQGKHEMTFAYSQKTWGNGKYVSMMQSENGTTKIEPLEGSINEVLWTDPLGQATTIHTGNGKTTGLGDPSKALCSATYVEGLLKDYTNSLGNVTSWEHDSRGNITSMTDALDNTTTYVYDNSDNLVTRRDAKGNDTFYTFDTNHNLKQARYPNRSIVNITYDSYGRLTAHTDARGKVTTYSYDSHGNRIGIKTPDGGRLTYGYNSHNCCEHITDSLGNQKTYAYDDNDRIVRVYYGVPPYPAQVRYAYDALDLLSVTDELGQRTSAVRNSDSLITTLTDPLNHNMQFEYDANGNLTKQTNPLYQKIITLYDEENRPIQTTDAKNFTVKRSFDSNGNLITFRDQRYNETDFTYDDNNRLKTIRNAMKQLLTYTYDSLGRNIETENGRGEKVIRSYDSMSNMTRKAYGSSTQADFTYDASGNLLTATHPVLGQKSYAYDDCGRAASITWPNGNKVLFEYDTEGNVKAITYPDSLKVSYQYDDFCRRKLPVNLRNGPIDDLSPHKEKKNQVTAINWPGFSISLQYDLAGNLLKETRSNNTISEYRYSETRKLTDIDHKNGGGVFLTIDNTYDAAGRRVSSEDNLDIIPPLPDSTATINYDQANQLSSFGGLSCTSDPDGNITAIGSSLIAGYDVENRPLSVTVSGKVIRYYYDAEGNPYRIDKKGITQFYHWDHNDRLLFITDSLGNLKSRFIYRGLHLAALQDMNSGTFFYHFDSLGNAVALTDKNGLVVSKYAYAPRGAYQFTGSNSFFNPFTFVGRYGVFEQGNGLYLMNSRLYHAGIGRFLQRDPLGLAVGSNLYVYAGNNPVGAIDPQGNLKFDPESFGDIPEVAAPPPPAGGTVGLPDGPENPLFGLAESAAETYGSIPGAPGSNWLNAARAARDENYGKATWEATKGTIGVIPGPGTAINITIDSMELLIKNKIKKDKEDAGRRLQSSERYDPYRYKFLPRKHLPYGSSFGER